MKVVIGHLAVKLRTAVAVSGGWPCRLARPGPQTVPVLNLQCLGPGVDPLLWPGLSTRGCLSQHSQGPGLQLLLRVLSAKCLRPLLFTLVCSLASQGCPRCTLHEGHPLKTVL